MSDPAQRKKINAEEYLAKHRVRWLVEHITTELLIQKPVRPLPFIHRRIREIASAQANKIQETSAKDAGGMDAIDSMLTSSEVESTRPRVLAVLGGPSSGKDLICAYLGDQGMTPLNVHDLVLNELKEGADVGKEISQSIEDGHEISGRIITDLIKRRIGDDHDTTYVINGFPNSMDQLMAFEAGVGEIGAVMFADCPEAVMKERMKATMVLEKEQTAHLERFWLKTYPVLEYFRALEKVTSIDTTASKDKMLATIKRIAWE